VDAGAAMITLHGRTRACGFRGAAEYETIAEVKAALHGARRVPVVANGDIQTPQQALDVLSKTGADAIMIGRAAQGRPWIFREILGFIDRGEIIAPPSLSEIRGHLTQHLLDHYQFHGEYSGVRTARKHMGWYSQAWHGGQALRERFNQLESAEDQLALIDAWFLEASDRTNSCPDEPIIAAFPSLN
jgi:tRNA-dihydrouridine synthase B